MIPDSSSTWQPGPSCPVVPVAACPGRRHRRFCAMAGCGKAPSEKATSQEALWRHRLPELADQIALTSVRRLKRPARSQEPTWLPTSDPHLAPMVPPGKPRPLTWREGILQIMVTRACDLSCYGCSQGSNLAGKPVLMSVAQFEQACESLAGYFGVVGLFGGNPCVHPHFEELCRILRKHFPFEQRGLWSNNLNGHGTLARITFNPAVSNLNPHMSWEATEEMQRDWPECRPFIRDPYRDSRHGSPWIALKDVVPDEAQRWQLIQSCDINQHWSALIGVVPGRGLRAWFCEVAYTIAALHADNPNWDGTGAPMPDIGVPVEPGWWRQSMDAFSQQVMTCCHSCGISLRQEGEGAITGQVERFTKTHEWVARPKVKGRPVAFVGLDQIRRTDEPSTNYLPMMTPGYRGPS